MIRMNLPDPLGHSAVKTIDLYEFYWAGMVQGRITIRQVLGWIARTSLTLNSPNDLQYKSDGSLYFTDPPYGLPQPEAKELDVNGVYRLTPDGTLTLLADQPGPNGIAFSPDESRLYVADSTRGVWVVYDVAEDGTLGEGADLLDSSGVEGDGAADGLKVDELGNLWATGPGGVWIISPDGRHLGTIRPTEVPANVAFGDADGRTLYMTARTGLYRIRVTVAGAVR